MSDYNNGYQRRYPTDTDTARNAQHPQNGAGRQAGSASAGQQGAYAATASSRAVASGEFEPTQRRTPVASGTAQRSAASVPNLFDQSSDNTAPRATQQRSAAAQQRTTVRNAPQPYGNRTGAPPPRASQADTMGATRQAPVRTASAQRSPASGSGRNASNGGRGGNRAGGSGGNGRNSGGNGGNGSGGRRSQKPSTAKVVFGYLLRAFFVLVCIGVVVGSILAVRAVRYVVDSTSDDANILDLERIAGSKTSYIMVQNSSGEWVEFQQLQGDSNSEWVELADIPQYMRDALISTEDRDFYDNEKGFYVFRTIYAGINDVVGFTRTFGASTIDQQLVKNLTQDKVVVGEDGDRSAGYERKMREIYRAWTLNKNYSKDMILEAYFNTMPLTGTIIGVKSGAMEYYYVDDLNQLTIAQCATIVGITNAPGRYHPYNNPENCLNRRNYILYNMFDQGYITQAEYDAAVAEGLGLYEGPRETNKATINSYFIDTVYEAFIEDYMEQYDASRGQAHRQFYNGGLRIYTTMDPTLQSEMETQYEKGYGPVADGYIFPESVKAKPLDENGDPVEGDVPDELMVRPQSAMVVIDYYGALKGVVGGIGEKTESLGLNRATQSERQVGSTMKPIASYALGIENGYIDYSSMLEDSGVQSTTGDPENLNWPRNYTGPGSGENIPVVDALAQSLNTIAVRVGMRVGEEEMFDFLVNTLDVTSLVEKDDAGNTDIALAPMVLGSMTHGITPYELAGTYQMFGNGGVYNTLHCYTEVRDSFDNIVLEPVIAQKQAISESTSYVMNRLLKNVLGVSAGTETSRAGTANGMALNYMDSVAKTGTTTDDKDRWFVGLTPYYVSVVWWGYDQPREMIDTNTGRAYSASARTNPPPVMWKTVMEAAQADLPSKDFPAMPTGVRQENFCRATGELATANCTDVQTGYYIEGTRVPNACFIHGGGFDGIPDSGGDAAA